MGLIRFTRGIGMVYGIQFRRGVGIFDVSGTPVSGTSGTYARKANPGSLLLSTNGQVYRNTNTKASPTWTQTFGGASATDGLTSLGVARVTFDPTGDATMRTVAAHTFGVTIPDKAVVVGGFMQVNTAPTSTNSTSTIAISVNAANDISTAAAVSGAPWSTTGLKAITPKANTPESTGIALTAARLVTATVAVEALLGGKVTIHLYYVQGN